MKIITLHCDYIKFKPLKKAIKIPEEIKEKGEKQVKEPLVVLTAIEKGDGEGTVVELVDAVVKTAKEVKAKNVVLYPYAHLSSNLALPEKAMRLLKNSGEALKKKGFNVTRTPFGYYKSFELKCKGHPLSELSKEFGAGREVTHPPTHKLSKPESSEIYDSARLLKEISRTKLDTSKLKENDHRILGQKLDLFSFNEAAPGAVFWHNGGMTIQKELLKFMRELLDKFDYEEVLTPQILDNRVWKISGHWNHYKDNMFLTNYEKRDFGVKPMNCPGGMLIYKTKTRSYKDLPMRMGEFGVVHRQELSGVLAGLFRVVKFTQDDAHIFCTEKQLEQEIKCLLELMKIVYKNTFGFDYRVELSTRPKKFIGEKKNWDFSEKALESVLKKSKIKFKINKGEGAFYGPKIDFHIKDSLNRSWQLGTIQLDMQMSKRFGITYVDKDNKEKTPLMLHRTILGSVERFIGILLEHTNGALPVWLAPVQVRVINFTERNKKATEKLVERLKKEGFRVDADLRSATVSEKVREAELLRIPYIIVIGDKEEKAKTLAVRERGKKVRFGVGETVFVKEVGERIEKRAQ